jgi:hypothetical protein
MDTPKAIVAIKDKPGRYTVIGLSGFFGVEVDERGRVHQLTPQGKRDGLLSDDGWLTEVEVTEYKT